VNNTTLAILAPGGQVYQLGDTVRFEASGGSGWGGGYSRRAYTAENQIDHLNEINISISKKPTYSNVPSDSPTARPAKDDIELVEKADLDKYRNRLTEGINVDVPESVNGWELVEIDRRDDDIESSIIASQIVTKMQWSNGERTNITAQWRGSYNCWYLSVPIEGVLSDKCVDKYMYEIDIPHQVVGTDTIIALAKKAMNEMNPTDFQTSYDLRESENIKNESSLHAGSVPTEFPNQLGDWVLEERESHNLKWFNQNENSAWHNFEVRIDSNGGVKIKNHSEDEIHDRRTVRKFTPSGDPYPGNINEGDMYKWRRRDMWHDNWFYSVAFMIQTSKENVDRIKVKNLNEQAPEDTELGTFDHELSTDVMKTMDRDNGSILAYS